MMYLAALLTGIIPVAALVFPGIVFAREASQNSLQYLARVVLWSITFNTVLSFFVALLGLPLLLTAATSLGVTALLWHWRARLPQQVNFSALLCVTILLVLYALGGAYFLITHDGLLTGDSQKAVYWAKHIITSNHLPNYGVATGLLNRDPVDFYTPGLHSLTAMLMNLSPLSLTTVGFFAIIVGVSLSLLAAATAQVLFPHYRWPWLLGAGTFVLMNMRFLRYLREPGYHYQNVIGELLLFGVVLLALSLIRQWRWLDSLLLVFLLCSLLITHQFSAFLAFFIGIPLAIGFFIKYLRHPAFKRYVTRPRLVGLLLIMGVLIAAGFALGLATKIPHIFTRTPHLANLVPPLIDYPRTLGYWWVFGGVAGGVLMAYHFWPWRLHAPQIAFLLSTSTLLLLSQGPRLGIDIPPVRALFYSVWPLSILVSYFFASVVTAMRTAWPRWQHAALAANVVIVIGIAGQSLVAAQPAPHTARTNSTLLAEYLSMNEQLAQKLPRAHVLIDDYNRRSSSWLLLSGHGMYTRIAADIRTHMGEESQSPLRRQLYERQLDFEKIFSLGSFPEIIPLLSDTDTRWITGISGSSRTAFAANPYLKPIAVAADVTLFEKRETSNVPIASDADSLWLLMPTTLANDIGDEEDTFEHLPASVRASRLSTPQQSGSQTYRVTSAPIIPLRFNIRDYVRPLLNPQHRSSPDTAFEFMIRLTAAPHQLYLQTVTGQTILLERTSQRIRLEPGELAFDADGFITLTLRNPTQALVGIDLIALGLAQVP